MTNFLAITIGNSRTRIGTFVEDELIDSLTIDNTVAISDLGATLTSAFEPLADNLEALVLLASVEPEVSRHVQRQVTETLGKQAVRMEQDVPIAVGQQLDPETIVGEDRLLNAAAAYDVLKQACVVIDAGTAMTVDYIDGTGTFHGGAIVPGPQMMLDALHERTAALPEVELNKPTEAIGHNTAEAMCTGVYHGLRGMVRELVEAYAEQTGAYPMIVATGGNAEFLFQDYDLIDRFVPDLTLLGMAVSLKAATKKRAES